MSLARVLRKSSPVLRVNNGKHSEYPRTGKVTMENKLAFVTMTSLIVPAEHLG